MSESFYNFLPLFVALGATSFLLALWTWVWHYVADPSWSGDQFYIRKGAYTRDPTSAPYCWRILGPMLARVAGFLPVTLLSSLGVAGVLYFYVGGGWGGCALVIAWASNRHLMPFHVREPELAEGLGHLIFVAALFSLHEGVWWAPVLGMLAAMQRESLGLALLPLYAIFNWVGVVLVLATLGTVYIVAERDTKNYHPLTERSFYATWKRWAKAKGPAIYHYSQQLQPLRWSPLSVPWVWNSVDSYTRLSLTAAATLWFFSIPASGASRAFAYAFFIFAPFVAALGAQWAWTYAIVSALWPIEISTYDETSDGKGGFFKAA